MPDTHLAMPRTLSAPYAGLLEAEAPRTTTSDALPDGTAAAAATFAGLLAPGDQAMDPKASTSTERNPDPFRASLLATTTIPALGMTFREAADQTRALLDAYSAIPEEDEDAQKKQVREWGRLEEAILSAPAQTFGDLFAKVERLMCPDLGIRALEQDDDEMRLLEEDVERLRPQIIAAASADAEIFAAFKHWADLVRDCCAAKADEDVRRLSDQADEAALNVMSYEPATREGLAAQVYLMLHLEHGGAALDHLEIDFLAQSDADHADGAAVQALVERIKRIGRQGAGNAPQETHVNPSPRGIEAHAHHLADAEIFSAFEQWKWDVVELVARQNGPDDDTFAAMCREVDALALRVVKPTPATMEGLAAQIYTMLHLQHAGVAGSPPDIAFNPPFNSDNPHTLAIHTIVNRVKLLGKTRVAVPSPSEELRQAWNELVALDAQVETLPPEALENGAYDAIAERSADAAGRILAAPVTTIHDLEILSRFALRALILFFGIDETQVRAWFVDGTLPADNERESVAALWRVAKCLRNLANATPDARVPAANDQRQDADAFADTVAAFEAEAPATLALPQEPTGRMVDAGASAAGITPAQFQVAYAAAVEALKLERAA
ncbi:hypothetical protein VH569_22795 [Azospirillum sp. 11R-A]|uniref:hypothetical protein n=1 Tax=Azospirillum sp. 11R-A TaxID=3111634 RepID=UPI003C1AA0D6